MKKETSVMEAISLDESKRLMGLEKTIQAGVETFITVGLALEEIRAARLYRAEFETFQEYCQKRWNFTKSRAFQLIDAAATVKALPPPLSTIVDTESAARALKKATSGGAKSPKTRRVKKRLEQAAEKKERVTAKDIEEAATEPDKESKPEPQKAMPFTFSRFKAMCDALEATIPDDCASKLREECGDVLYRAAERQMNWSKPRKGAFAYGR